MANGIFPVTGNLARTKTEGFRSEMRELRDQFNKLVQQVTLLAPGVLASAPSTKTGTTSAKTWRNEAFNFWALGLYQAKAAAETAFTVTAHNVAATKEAWFVMTIANGGAITITKAADQTIGTVVLPAAPANGIVVAYLQIVTGATGWAATVDDLTADGLKIASLKFVDAPFVETVNLS